MCKGEPKEIDVSDAFRPLIGSNAIADFMGYNRSAWSRKYAKDMKEAGCLHKRRIGRWDYLWTTPLLINVYLLMQQKLTT